MTSSATSSGGSGPQRGPGPQRAEGHSDESAWEIISEVSHELRTPLTSVKGYTSLLLKRWGQINDEEKKFMLEQVNHDADRVTRLLTELLDISRLESGRLRLRRQWVHLAILIPIVVDKVRLEYPDLRTKLEIDPACPPAFADADKVEQVLSNLLENACKYASPTGLVVRAGPAEKEPARAAESGGPDQEGLVAVSVTDRGAGIPPEDLPRVFDKFFRRSEGRPTGSGLGLWISRGLVEAHGGHLTAASTEGEGTTFRFTLPRADVMDMDDNPGRTHGENGPT